MSRALAGRRILLTRRAEQSSGLRARLEALGGRVWIAPAIEIVPPEDTGPLDRALGSLHRYHWILFTSPNAVRAVRERLDALGLGTGLSGRGVRIGSVGPGTSEAVRRDLPGADVNVEPSAEFQAEGLLAALGDVAGQSFLLPASDRARDVLPRTLAARGGRVDVVVAYRTVAPPDLSQRLAEVLRNGVDLVVFASPSAVESFVASGGAAGTPAAVIGPVTERAARLAGLDVRVIAQPSTEDGLVAALEAWAGGGPSQQP